MLAIRVPVACASCSKPKSETAVVCPHCGAIDANLDPRQHGPAERKGRVLTELSAAEAVALVGGVKADPPAWRAFLLPAITLRGPAVLLDVVLIVLTLPLLLGAFLTLARRRLGWGRTLSLGASYVEGVLVALVAGGVILAVAAQAGFFAQAAPLVAVSLAALLGRVALRSWSKRAAARRVE